MGLRALRRARLCALFALALLVGEAAAAQFWSTTPPARAAAGAPPVAVFVHGGGWVSGTPAMGDPMVGFFASRGVAFSAIDYPKRPLALLSLMVGTVQRQLGAAAATGPLTVVGHSAGAHLAATAAFRPGAPLVRCLILLDGIGYDLVDLVTRQPGVGVRLGLVPALAAPFSPAALVPDSARRPAVFIAAGNDARGTAEQARAFARVLEGNGMDVTLRVFTTAVHSDFLTEFAIPTSQVAKNVAAFLAAHPKCTGAAAAPGL